MDYIKLANIGFFKGLGSAIKGKNALNYLRQFKTPTHNYAGKGNFFLPKKQIPLDPSTPVSKRISHGFKKGVRSSLGNTADSLAILGQGVKGKGVIEGTAQAGKNIIELGKRQIKSDLYREVSNPILIKDQGKTFAKSKWAFGKNKEVVGKTNRDSVIVRRRKLYDPISIAAGGSGPVIGLGVYALGDKNRPQKKRITEAATDAALFSISPPLGFASIPFRTAANTSKKDQIKKLKEKRKNEL